MRNALRPKLVTEAPWWESIKPGDLVTWNHTSSAWGAFIPIDAEVIKVNAKTVSIKVTNNKNGTTVMRQVRPDKLRRREP